MAEVDFTRATAPVGIRLYAIGDIHGRLDLLEKMQAAITVDLQAAPDVDWRVVYLGDYIDRGPASKGVIDNLVQRSSDHRNIFIAGNHDEGLLDFLRNPDPHGIFPLNGGRETAESYNLDLWLDDLQTIGLEAAQLRSAMPEDHLNFFAGLQYSWTAGDFFFCHAGIHPGVPLDRQDADDLLWIRTPFHEHDGLYEKVVIHGHTPVKRVNIRQNRVNLDTGAWQSGILSAIIIDGDTKRFIKVTE